MPTDRILWSRFFCTCFSDCLISFFLGSYLPSSYSFSPYGSKVSGGEDADKARASPSVSCKASSESKALDILQQHASHYKSKSPTVSRVQPMSLSKDQEVEIHSMEGVGKLRA